MKKKNNLLDILITVLLSSFVGIVSGASLMLTMDNNGILNKVTKKSQVDEITDMYEEIKNEYYKDVDDESLIEGAISGMLSVLDTNTSYMNKNNTTAFNNKMKGEYYGVGIDGLTLEDTGILVVTILKDSPADKAGIKENDILIELNSISLKDKTSTYFSDTVSKEKNNLEIAVMRNNERLEFELSADKITINSVTTNTFYRDSKKIGYIKISIFAANTASQFTTKLKGLEESGITSLIIDVRDNAGGYLSNVATILELFMKKGTVLYKTETKDATTNRKDSTNDYRKYPIIVLVNGSSASASEILAACFKANYNADLIGNTTYGKGTVQETINVLDGSMAKITTKKWLTPNGEWINGKGIEPTVKVDINDIYLKNPIFDNDNQLASAIDIIIRK